MFNSNIYIANADVKPDLPVFDMNEIPPLPAFQTQQSIPVQQQSVPFYQTSGFMITALVLLCIIFAILTAAVIRLSKQFAIAAPSVLKQNQGDSNQPSKKDKFVDNPINAAEKAENEDKRELKDAFNLKKINLAENKDKLEEEMSLNFDLSSSEDDTKSNENEDASLKLGTPKSIQKCIKSFLEVTLEA